MPTSSCCRPSSAPHIQLRSQALRKSAVVAGNIDSQVEVEGCNFTAHGPGNACIVAGFRGADVRVESSVLEAQCGAFCTVAGQLHARDSTLVGDGTTLGMVILPAGSAILVSRL